jgi:hypothetical protein
MDGTAGVSFVALLMCVPWTDASTWAYPNRPIGSTDNSKFRSLATNMMADNNFVNRWKSNNQITRWKENVLALVTSYNYTINPARKFGLRSTITLGFHCRRDSRSKPPS